VTSWQIQSAFVRAEIQSLGAMLGPAWFKLGAAEVQPFAIAPWADDSGDEYRSLPKLLQRMRGEWACVPFGMERPATDLPSDWQPDIVVPVNPHPHGWSSNAQWEASIITEESIELTLAYPPSHPVRVLRRSIRASDESPRLDISLEIEVRTPCTLPIGVHPTFRLPLTPRRALVGLGGAARAWTSPVPLEPLIARFRSDVRDVPVHQIPLIDGTEDITQLPLPYTAEEIVLVRACCGRALLSNLDERYAVTLLWDPDIFPACQLWLSNRGRTSYPWRGRFLALGIEPIRAAFDLGTGVSQNRLNPLWRAGVPCAVSLSPTQPLETCYAIQVAKLDR
jgi:hypothetical protein